MQDVIIQPKSQTDYQQFTRDLIQQASKNIRQENIAEALKCYQTILRNQPSFINHYFSHIFKTGIKLNKPQLLAELVDLYPQLVEAIQPYTKHTADPVNIYHCSVPKAATTWLRKVLIHPRITINSGLLPFPVEFIQPNQLIPQKTIVTGTFAISYDEFIQLKKPDNYKAFFVMRDPRDIVISAYFSHRYSHKLMGHIEKTREILNNLSLEEGLIHTIENLQGIFNILNSWIEAPSKDPKISLFRYEELTGDDQEVYFQKLFNHCDFQVSESLLKRLLEIHSFQKLANGRTQGSEDHNSHYRKGVSGDWQNYFNEKIRAKFEEVTGDLTERLGYVWQEKNKLGKSDQSWLSTEQKEQQVSLVTSNLGKYYFQLARKYHEAGELDTAIQHYQSSIKNSPTHSAHSYFYLALISYGKQNYEQAISLYEQALKNQPQLTDAYFYLGAIHYKQKKLEPAIHFYKKFIKQKPEVAEAQFYVGCILFQQNQLNKALEYFLKCIEIKPDLADAYFYLGEIHLKKGSVKQSVKYRQKYKLFKKKQ